MIIHEFLCTETIKFIRSVVSKYKEFHRPTRICTISFVEGCCYGLFNEISIHNHPTIQCYITSAVARASMNQLSACLHKIVDNKSILPYKFHLKKNKNLIQKDNFYCLPLNISNTNKL